LIRKGFCARKNSDLLIFHENFCAQKNEFCLSLRDKVFLNPRSLDNNRYLLCSYDIPL